MNEHAEILALIPARGGSKGIPRKNLALVGGRTLLSHTCAAALAATRLNRTILSTDDEEIVAEAGRCGIEVPFRRPAELATDETAMFDVVEHALQTLSEAEGYRPDIAVLLQPTSPLRSHTDIDAAVDLLLGSRADSVVSVVEVPHRFSQGSLMTIADDRLSPIDAEWPREGTRRQDKPKLYARNGPAVLATRVEVITDHHDLYGEHVRPFIMDGDRSVDVDSAFDLELAEFLLSRRPLGRE